MQNDVAYNNPMHDHLHNLRETSLQINNEDRLIELLFLSEDRLIQNKDQLIGQILRLHYDFFPYVHERMIVMNDRKNERLNERMNE